MPSSVASANPVVDPVVEGQLAGDRIDDRDGQSERGQGGRGAIPNGLDNLRRSRAGVASARPTSLTISSSAPRWLLSASSRRVSATALFAGDDEGHVLAGDGGQEPDVHVLRTAAGCRGVNDQGAERRARRPRGARPAGSRLVPSSRPHRQPGRRRRGTRDRRRTGQRADRRLRSGHGGSVHRDVELSQVRSPR